MGKIGFSLGGLTRRFLVKPPSMIWPTNLVNCALFNTLHSQKYAGIGRRGGISRERFFLYTFVASAVWYLFPGYLFTALSTFSWVCWIAPNHIVINQMFGYLSGLGMSSITFDWAQIAYIGSPLATPWWVIANIGASFVFFYCKSSTTVRRIIGKTVSIATQGSSRQSYTIPTLGMLSICRLLQ